MLIILQGTPPSKKNSKRILRTRAGKPFIKSSENYLAWEKGAKLAILSQVPKGFEAIDKCKISLSFVLCDNRRRDLTNMAEGVMDCLVSCGIIKDDCYQVVTELHMIAHKKDTAMVGILIYN